MKKSVFALAISSIISLTLMACGGDSGTATDDTNISWKKGGDGKFYKTGSMVDPRDGKTYKTVKIGDQVWMAENLAFYDTLGMPELTSEPTASIGFWPTDIMPVAISGDESQESEPLPVQESSGCTYTYDVAMNFDYFSDTSYNDGICPPGWHLPIMAEFDILKSNILLMCDSTAPCTKLDEGWKKTETFWTSTPANGVRINSTYGYSYRSNSSDAVSYTVDVENFTLFGADFSGKSSRLNVRCVQGAAADSLVALKAYNQNREKNIEAKRAADSVLQYVQNGAKNYFNENLEYGYFTDTRDSNVYGYLKIGNYTWMTENMRYYIKDQYYYSCEKYLGCVATSYADSVDFFKTGLTYRDTVLDRVCPTGWHVPSREEWKDLFAVDSNAGSYLATDGNWPDADGIFNYNVVNNATGFTAISTTNKTSVDFNEAYFWTSTDTVEVTIRIDTVFIDSLNSVDTLATVDTVATLDTIPADTISEESGLVEPIIVPDITFVLDTTRTETHYHYFVKYYWFDNGFVIPATTYHDSYSVRCVMDH